MSAGLAPTVSEVLPTKQGAGPWLLGSLLLFAVGGFLNVTWFVAPDESWFLQVVARVNSGEVLYRDVFYGAMPLAVYVASAATRCFGTDILVLKGLLVACFVLTALMICRIARQLGVAPRFPALLAVAFLAFAPPSVVGAGSLYTPLASLLSLCCYSAALSWLGQAQGRSARALVSLVVAGCAAGLCFSAKHNMGLLVLLALLLTSLSRGAGPASRRLAGAAVVTAAFVLTVGLVLLPVWYSGASENFIDYCFTNKTRYLRLAGISYTEGFWQAPPLFLLPPVSLGALALAWWRSDSQWRERALVVLLFLGASLAGAYPRIDRAHLAVAVPELLLALAYSWPLLRKGLSRPANGLLRHCLWLLFVGWSALWLAIATARLAEGDLRRMDLPHFRGMFAGRADRDRAHFRARVLGKLPTQEGRLFLLLPDAGFYYLASGLENPTPYDYPLATAFGRHGIQHTISLIQSGRIEYVAIDTQVLAHTGRMRPTELEDYVRTHMVRCGDVGLCELYRADGAADEGRNRGIRFSSKRVR